MAEGRRKGIIQMKTRFLQTGTVTSLILAGNILAWLVNIAAGSGSVRGLFLFGGGYVEEWGKASYQTVMVLNQWWRLSACGYLHLGIFHLAFNLYALWIVGSKMEKCLGHVKFFLAYHLETVITVFLWCLLFQKRSMVGASTGIFFVIGIYVALCRREDFMQDNPLLEGHRRYLIGYTLVSCLLGIGTIAAHGIGFAMGAIFANLGRRLLLKDS